MKESILFNNPICVPVTWHFKDMQHFHDPLRSDMTFLSINYSHPPSFVWTFGGTNYAVVSFLVEFKWDACPSLWARSCLYYPLIFRSNLRLDDFGILVEDDEFLRDPFAAINRTVLSLSAAELQRKIKGLSIGILAANCCSRPLCTIDWIHSNASMQLVHVL